MNVARFVDTPWLVQLLDTWATNTDAFYIVTPRVIELHFTDKNLVYEMPDEYLTPELLPRVLEEIKGHFDRSTSTVGSPRMVVIVGQWETRQLPPPAPVGMYKQDCSKCPAKNLDHYYSSKGTGVVLCPKCFEEAKIKHQAKEALN